ncbi:MAG: IMP cyclohydrolase [Oscillospiraceae bacterium]|nr:IMP cyclohydrolase [Oscillospiraceae bacterium]
MIENILDHLKNTSYPGRGILIGRNEENTAAYVVYFIMGRSSNSRNRIFSYTDDGIRTEAYDPSLLEDPSLIIYHPVRLVGDKLVVTNGDQTDTIRDYLVGEGTFRDALKTREFEPDMPNCTPRISGIVFPNGDYSLSILKSADNNPDTCLRYFFDYAKPLAGEGRFISTYQGDGSPLPSFAGEPKRVAVSGSLEDYANSIWDALNEDNKVSLYACEMNLATGDIEEMVINKHEQGD